MGDIIDFDDDWIFSKNDKCSIPLHLSIRINILHSTFAK